jgi:curved DNA-binding protein CbpA
MSTPTYYQTLGVAPDATRDTIKKAYYALVAVNHPDKTYFLPEAERECRAEAFKAQSAAWELLRDENTRLAYNLKLRESQISIQTPQAVRASRQRPDRSQTYNPQAKRASPQRPDRSKTYNPPPAYAPPIFSSFRPQTAPAPQKRGNHPEIPMDEFINASAHRFTQKLYPNIQVDRGTSRRSKSLWPTALSTSKAHGAGM